MNTSQAEQKSYGQICHEAAFEGSSNPAWDEFQSKSGEHWERRAQAVISAYRGRMKEGWRLLEEGETIKDVDEVWFFPADEWRVIHPLKAGLILQDNSIVRRRCYLGDDFVDRDMQDSPKDVLEPEGKDECANSDVGHGTDKDTIIFLKAGNEALQQKVKALTELWELEKSCGDELRKRLGEKTIIDIWEGRDEVGELQSRNDTQAATIVSLNEEIRELKKWKESSLVVEHNWDVQEVGREMGLAAGQDIRENILPFIRALKRRITTGGAAAEMLSKKLDEANGKIAALRAPIHEAYKTAPYAPQSPESPPWISVNERMPTLADTQPWRDPNDTRVARVLWLVDDEVHSFAWNHIFPNATHWMPIPPIPPLPQPKDAFEEFAKKKNIDSSDGALWITLKDCWQAATQHATQKP